MYSIGVPAQIEYLRAIGGDTWNIEAKSAAGGLPDSLDEPLSAFANMPEGGLILLGVSENESGIEVTGVADAQTMMEQPGSKARQRLHPPVQLGAVEVQEVEGRKVGVHGPAPGSVTATFAEIRQAAGLTSGQLNPMLTQLLHEHILEPTEPPKSPNKRYRLAGG